ncbi:MULTISPECIES: LytTR family DNA-binding domain-containing protein [Stenotrophomonas]|jgi:two-component system LytT family response regulator|uniref:Two component transcriptional regulator, LytTR family n=1 Tax=Stenotrophomonas indicatrix TaxID=2045451 RepID=A0A1W1H1D6_9GAMM|nr:MULTISPECIES: LytTR family DNA-binding domain-containing protein [Stenotrophomonas]OJH78028.1 MAG: DNA-binding response regulator [Stenotrophomonas maltophilia]MDF2482590.1 two component transcriptional regulator, LytTR family [Stenotrophomonas indicatrix]MDH6332259.1 two-component system LytT family response regulator [Stenotrophomonas sp. 1278]MDR6694955.1 two-component system LytT family response regulator [Stenotrophomonas sp. 1337]TPD66729.1 response regulator transcription factor [Ste
MTAVLRVLIVDDARLARQELRTLLSALPWVQCVGEADDVPAAREAIAALAPDLVLLDVQMPSGTGFDVLDGLERVPSVVFVTAYDTYAVRAFRANALDYLVKPVEAPRLLEALERARHHAALDTEPPTVHGTLGAQDQVFVREGERCWFVSIAEIRRLVVDGNYTRLWFRDQNALLARSLSALEARLPSDLFFRANRNTLVNLRRIRAVTPSIGDGYDLALDDGSEVEVSRRQARELRERMAL